MPSDFEDKVYSFVEGIGDYDFSNLLRLLIAVLIVLWVFVAFWAWEDVKERTNSFIIAIFVALIVFVFPIVGLAIYLLARPRWTIEEKFWMDLERRHLLYETAELGDCHACGAQLSVGYQFCRECGEPVAMQCKGCGEQFPLDSRFCPYCGLAVTRHEVANSEATKTKVRQELTEMEMNIERTQQRVEETEMSTSTIRPSIIEQIGASTISIARKIFLPWFSLFEAIGDGVRDGIQSVLQAGKMASEEYIRSQESEQDGEDAGKEGKPSSENERDTRTRDQEQSNGDTFERERDRSRKKKRRKKKKHGKHRSVGTDNR